MTSAPSKSVTAAPEIAKGIQKVQGRPVDAEGLLESGAALGPERVGPPCA
jgi:hypothetical protein